MKNKKLIVLEKEQPILHTYNHYAHMLSILQCNTETLPWIMSNFIQLYIYQDARENLWGDFYFPFPYELKPFDNCKWLLITKVRREQICQSMDTMIEYLYEELEKGYYPYMYVNHWKLKTLGNRRENKCHDAMVYGIDMEKRSIYLTDTFFDGKYENSIVGFEEFFDAVKECNISTNKDFFQKMVYSFKVKRKTDYMFDLRNIENSLYQYSEGKVPEYWKMFNSENAPKMVFGKDIYFVLRNYLEVIAKGEQSLYIQNFYLLMEHKKMMKIRFSYLISNNIYSFDCMQEIVVGFTKLEEMAYRIILILLKFYIVEKGEMLLKVDSILVQMMDFEKTLLEKYFRIINYDRLS